MTGAFQAWHWWPMGVPGGCFHRPERVALALVRDPWPTQPTQPTIRAPPSLNFVDLRKSHHRKLWEEELDLTIHDVATILLQSSPALLVHISAHSAARTTKLRAGTSSDHILSFLLKYLPFQLLTHRYSHLPTSLTLTCLILILFNKHGKHFSICRFTTSAPPSGYGRVCCHLHRYLSR